MDPDRRPCMYAETTRRPHQRCAVCVVVISCVRKHAIRGGGYENADGDMRERTGHTSRVARRVTGFGCEHSIGKSPRWRGASRFYLVGGGDERLGEGAV